MLVEAEHLSASEEQELSVLEDGVLDRPVVGKPHQDYPETQGLLGTLLEDACKDREVLAQMVWAVLT